MQDQPWRGESVSHARLLEFLRSQHADGVDHSGRTLLAHLMGTHELLKAWACPEHLCHAGLFHSVYGTEVFRHGIISVADREQVRDLIGPEAEAIVYLYSIVSRDSLDEQAGQWGQRALRTARGQGEFHVSEERYADLLTLDLANALEQLPRLTPSERASWPGRDAYHRAAAVLPERAIAALSEASPRAALFLRADGGCNT